LTDEQLQQWSRTITNYEEEKAMPMKNPPHPGNFIRTETIEPAGLTVTAPAAALQVSRPALSSLLNGKADLSGDMALRLEKAFGVKMDNEILEPETPETDRRSRSSERVWADLASRCRGRSQKAKPAKLPKHLGPRVYERNAILFTLKHARAC
jgi:addiction module HigA family antidote